jgi:hypothetical protein
MWKPEHRAAADRHGLRYPSDLTDAEWALVAPLIRPAKRGGRPRTVDVREVLNAIFFSIRRVGVKALLGTSAMEGCDRPCRLLLLSGIGTKALP